MSDENKVKIWPTEKVNRKKIQNAPYNPRVISKEGLEKIRNNIKTRGLMGGIVWNKRTGNLVGGHQRLKAIDVIEGNDKYELECIVVDLSEKEEKEQNIFLNNPLAQGDFEYEKLRELLQEENIVIDDAGFTRTELYKLYGDDIMIDKGLDNLVEAANALRDAAEVTEKVRNIKSNKRGHSFYCLLIFKDDKEREEVLKRYGIEDNKYCDGNELIRKVSEYARGRKE